jgi:protoporphyrinogen oxidase
MRRRLWRSRPAARRSRQALPRAQAAATPVPRTPRSVRHLIVGAGPTGLAAALHLSEHGAARADTLLVEREQRVGGWCRSLQQQGYTFDHAGHIMFSTDPQVLALYERLLGSNLRWQNREAWIYSKKVYTRYPFQGSLHGLPPQVLKECLVGAIEARFGSLRADAGATATVSPPANFEEFVLRTWGRGIAEHFALPYNRKLWTVPLTEMETSWLGGRVPLPDLEQIIEGALRPTPTPMGPNARFGYPLRGGFQALMDAFVPLLQCELELGTNVLQVNPSRRTVRLDDGRIVAYRTLINTMPLPRLIEACGDEAPPEVRAAARALRSVGVRCVNLGVGLPAGCERLSDKHWIYYPEDTVFHRIFLQGNASPYNSPPGGFALTCEISYSDRKPLPCDGAALIERVVADCRRVGLLGEHNPVQFAAQVDMPCAYVVYDHARSEHVATIRRWLGAFGIVLAGRYAEWEYYNSDHAFIAGRRAAEQALRSAPQAELAQAS